MNFGAFAGGFAQGMDNGMRIGKSIRDMLREKKLDDLRQQGMAEAEQARAQSVNDLIKEQGVSASETPKSGPVATEQPKVAEDPAKAQAVSESSPTANPDAAAAKTAAFYQRPGSGLAVQEAADAFQNGAVNPAAPTANPDPAGAATAAAAMPPATTSPVQATPTQEAQAKPVTTQQSVAIQGVAGPKFTVNGVGYDTREQAKAAAERAAPTTMDMFLKNAAPKIAQQYMVNGDPATAKAWMDYSESQAGKRAIKDWAAAYSAPDFDTAVSRFGKYYTDHINDGVDYDGHTMKINADGTQVAVVKLKDKASGKVTEMELTREKMIALGGANNPQHLFETERARQQEAEKLKLQAQLKANERREKMQDDMKVEGYKAGLKDKGEQRKQDRLDNREKFQQDRMDQRERIKSIMNIKESSAKVQAEMDTKIDALIGAGYGEDEIKRMMPAIAGAGEHKKTTDPTERRAIITAELLKTNPGFARKSQEEQSKMVDDMMGVIYGPGAKPSDSGKPASGASAAQTPASAPGIATKPMAYDPKLPVKWRKDTGQPYHLINGQYVPISGSVPLPAGGLPVQ